MIRESEKQSRLTLEDIRSALEAFKEQRESALSSVEVLYELASNKQALARKIAGNKDILKKFGNEAEILKELGALETKYQDQIHAIEAGKNFGENVEKRSWGKWALEKIKSVVKFPVRHPIISLIVLAAVGGGVAGYMGYLPSISVPFAEWLEKLKALFKGKFGFGAGGAGEGAPEAVGAAATDAVQGAGAYDAVEAASKAATETLEPLTLRTFGHQVGYAGKVYEMKDLPSLIEALPAIKPGQLFDVLRDASSKPTVEGTLRNLIAEKYGDGVVNWVNGPPP